MKLVKTIKMKKEWVGNIIMRILDNFCGNALTTDEVFFYVQQESSGCTEVIVYSHSEVVTALKSLRNCRHIEQYYSDNRVYWAACDKDAEPFNDCYCR